MTAAPATVVRRPRAGPARLPAAVLATSVAVGLATAVDPLLGAGAALLAAAAVVTLVEPDVATLALLALLYSNTVGVAVRFHGAPAAVAAVLPLAFLVPFAHAVIQQRRPVRFTPAFPFLVAFLVVHLASAATSTGDRATAVTETVSFAAEGVVLFLLVVNVVRTPAQLRRATGVVVAVSAALAGLTIVQSATGTFGNDYLGYAQYGLTTGPAVLATKAESASEVATDGSDRPSGPVGEPNRYAQVLLVIVPLALALGSGAALGRARHVAGGAAAVVLVIAIALTLSRGAAVALAAMLVVGVALRTVRLTHLALVAATVAVLLAAVPAVADRLASLGAVAEADDGLEQADGSIRSRYTEAQAALLAVADHPVLGVGPGQFPAEYPGYAQLVGGRPRPEPRQAHNLVLGVAADTGLAGLACAAGAIGVTIAALVRTRRRLAGTDPASAALATGYLLAVVGYLGAGMFLHLSYARYLWLLLALAAAAGAVETSGRRLATHPDGRPTPSIGGRTTWSPS